MSSSSPHPGTTAPDAAPSDAALPDTAAPDTAAPDTAAPDTAAPDTAAPEAAAPARDITLAPDWWRRAVVYQVYPRAFADGNGDGTGDLAGVRDRLPYLGRLGVDALWLSPFYRSPMADGGYDVAGYREVDPRFGTLADFDALLAGAHQHGIAIIVDLVPNHCSDQHPWFGRALADGPGSAARDRFWFRDGRGPGGAEPPNNWRSVFGGPAWTRVPDGQWYLHLFAPEQPDFNWNHPAVRAEFEDILRFWLDRGVDGFRIDVAHGLVKAPGLPDADEAAQSGMAAMAGDGGAGLPYFDQDGVHEIYRSWRRILNAYSGTRMAVAEAWVSSPERLARYIGPDELHQAFSFDFMMAGFDAVQYRKIISTALAEAELVGAPATWVLGNHDKPRQVTRYGGGATGLRRARAAALLMLALPGSAYLYNGEELGLDEVTDIPDQLREDPAFARTGESRDGCRVPLPWSGTQAQHFGFGPPGGTAPRLPQPARWAGHTAADQEDDPGSTLRLYRSALALRRSHDGWGETPVTWLSSPDGVLAFRRGPGLTVVVNTSDRDAGLRDYQGSVILASETLTDPAWLPPGTAAWIGA